MPTRRADVPKDPHCYSCHHQRGCARGTAQRARRCAPSGPFAGGLGPRRSTSVWFRLPWAGVSDHCLVRHELPPYEDPATLRARLRLGREEFCQRLLTTLILGGYYPRWNTPHNPSTAGEAFLHRLHQLAGLDGWTQRAMFIDEFDLPARTPNERGGAPDWVVRWPDRLWMIELKTEAGSHRPGQLQAYATLARHHHPESRVDLTYLTPPLRATVSPLDDGTPVVHLSWTDVVPLVAETWGSDSDDATRRTANLVCEVLLALDQPLTEWRSLLPAADPTLTEMVGLARQTAQDGTQRAIECRIRTSRSFTTSAWSCAPLSRPTRRLRP